jgi:hypothetical protein
MFQKKDLLDGFFDHSESLVWFYDILVQKNVIIRDRFEEFKIGKRIRIILGFLKFQLI